MEHYFEWDPDKNEQNIRKHGISFKLASEVFADPFLQIVYDPDHPDDENRYISTWQNQEECDSHKA